MSDIAIKVDQVSKVYRLYDRQRDRLKDALNLTRKKCYREHFALDQLDFEIKKGEIFALLGVNGAGKTTALECIEGLRKYDSGTITVNGKMGIQLQSSSLPAHIKPMEAVRLFSKWNRAKIDFTMLNALGMKEIEKKQYIQLSTGQKRRLHLALALIGDPDIIFLDEPTAGLDPAGRDEILDLVARMHRERGITVILVSHSMEDIAKYVQRIIVMNHGEVMFDDTPSNVFAHYRELEAVGLAAPQVTYLMHELKSRGLSVNTEAITVEEARESLIGALTGIDSGRRDIR